MRFRRETYAGGKRGDSDSDKKGNKKKLKKGSILDIATTDVISTPPTSTIMGALKLMITYNFRRVPVVDPGTHRIEGILTSTDIINFFGGGKKHKIVEERYDNNLLAAINEEVREIMERDVRVIDFTSDWIDVLEMMLSHGVGGCPIVDRSQKIIGITTERNLLEFLATQSKFDGIVKDYMVKSVITAKPDTSIEEAMKTMISKKIRRLPVVDDGILLGMLTSTTLLRYFGSGDAFKMLVTGNADDVLHRKIKILISDKSILKYKELLTYPPKERISHVAKEMIEKNHGAALIIQEELKGIITERDLVSFLYNSSRK